MTFILAAHSSKIPSHPVCCAKYF